jgi:hypothetical protein
MSHDSSHEFVFRQRDGQIARGLPILTPGWVVVSDGETKAPAMRSARFLVPPQTELFSAMCQAIPPSRRRRSRRSHSLWQLFARQLRDHELGVTVRPVRIRVADAPLVLAVNGRSAPKRARQVARGAEGSRGSVDALGKPRRDLLHQPDVAIRVAECGEGAVGVVIGRWSADATARTVRLELTARRPGRDRFPVGTSTYRAGICCSVAEIADGV